MAEGAAQVLMDLMALAFNPSRGRPAPDGASVREAPRAFRHMLLVENRGEPAGAVISKDKRGPVLFAREPG